MKRSKAAKALIVKDGFLLIVKRALDDDQKPGIWELPGGRIDEGEEINVGLIRETKEETGIDIEIIKPLNLRNFTRDDGQKIAMTVFICKPFNDNVVLSKEHTDFEWISLEKCKEKLGEFFHVEIDIYNNLEKNK